MGIFKAGGHMHVQKTSQLRVGNNNMKYEFKDFSIEFELILHLFIVQNLIVLRYSLKINRKHRPKKW